MQNLLKTLVFGLIFAAGLAVAAPASAQTYNPYYYPQYGQSYFGQSSLYGYGSNCPRITFNLTLGSSDYATQGQVSQLQSFLRSRYGDSRLSGGYYGSLTAYYVTRFQQESGVYPATGGVGPMTRAAIERACGGYTSGYPTYPNNPSTITFRLDRTFNLYEGQRGRLSNGELEIVVTEVDSRNDEVEITVGLTCRQGTYCFYYPNRSYTLEEDDTVTFQGYDIELTSVSSNRATFRVTDEDDNDNDDDDATIEVTAPTGSKTVEQGDELEIEWESDDEPNNTSVILELFESDGDRVGTIAISDDTDGDYEWDVPEGGDFCTQQFPNGLCGYDLEGRYYIKASLVRGNGFNNGEVLDTDNSATFRIED